jgi:hypothetical protein
MSFNYFAASLSPQPKSHPRQSILSAPTGDTHRTFRSQICVMSMVFGPVDAEQAREVFPED